LQRIKLIFTIFLIITFTSIIIGCNQAEGINRLGSNRSEIETGDLEAMPNNNQAIVSAHRLATEAGFEILGAGGTAADAAVAVAAVLTVVEPFFSSALGGGTWALYYEAATGEVTSLDGVGPVGSNASVEDYAEKGGLGGMHQAVVPGAWDGWMLWLQEYGRLDLGEVLAPAIEIGREGFTVTQSLELWLDRQSQLIAERPDTAEIYMPEGRLLRQGDILYQHDLADTFEVLAEAYEEEIDQGREQAIQAARDYFYRGPLAEAIVDFSDTHGGYLTLEDFHGFEASIVEPISIQYNEEIKVFQNPPNSQGITQLIALNILKDDNLSQLGPDNADAIHLQVEALKLAFSDRYYHVGDPELTDVPVEELLSDEHARQQRQRIDMETVMEWPIEDGLAEGMNNTTTFHIVDGDGNGAAVTTSLGAQFLVIGDTGIHINNRMRMISIEEDNPNQLTPGYKVRHTSNPYLALRDGSLYILGGNTGVDNQPQGQMQQFIHIVEFGLSAQEAIDRPRFATTAFPEGTFPYEYENTLELEEGFPQEAIDELSLKGHEVIVGGAYGSANMIVVDEDDIQVGAEIRDESYGEVKESR